MPLWLKLFWHKFFICCTYLPVIFKINGNTTWAYYLQKSNDELIFLKMNVSDLACCFCETIVVLYVCENMCGILEICYILAKILAIILVIGHHILGAFFFWLTLYLLIYYLFLWKSWYVPKTVFMLCMCESECIISLLHFIVRSYAQAPVHMPLVWHM